MQVAKRDIDRVILGLVAAIVVTLVVILPVLYFTVGWQSRKSHLQTEAEIYAIQVSSIINRNPDMWRYEVIRLEGLLSKQRAGENLESCRVLDLEGKVVVKREENVPWPVMKRSQPLMDSGAVVGSLEVALSLL